MKNNISFSVKMVEKKVSRFQKDDKKIFISSSFQTHSIPLLHLMASIDNTIPVYFLNTGFHFPETLTYRDEIATLLKINVISLSSSTSKIHQKDNKGRFFFCSNPDLCCHINKIEPLEPILMSNDVWITGVRRDQNANRKSMEFEMKGPFDTVRFHPMLDWTSKMIWEYRKEYDLPPHPLEKDGYLSVGCEPCTQRYVGDGRDGRWQGMKKNECGLHTDLIKK